MFKSLSMHRVALLALALLAAAALPPIASASPVLGTDASVWDSSVPNTGLLLPVGGSGQLNGEFVVENHVDQGSALQVGLRAQERFVGPVLPRTGNVYFAAPGTSGGGSGATWNYDVHLDLGTSDADTGVPGESLESALGQSLTPLNLRDFTVELALDLDPSPATSFATTDLNQAIDDFFTAGGLTPPPEVRLFQTSQNYLFSVFGTGPGVFDPDAPGLYDLRLTVSDGGGPVGEAAIQVAVGSPVDLAVTVAESTDPVTAGSGPGNLVHTVTVTNQGPADATGVEIDLVSVLPADVSLDSVLPDAGTLSGSTWLLGALPAGGSATLIRTMTVGPDAVPATDAVVTDATLAAAGEPDIAPGNDGAAAATSIERQAVTEVPTLSGRGLLLLALLLGAGALLALRRRARA